MTINFFYKKQESLFEHGIPLSILWLQRYRCPSLSSLTSQFYDSHSNPWPLLGRPRCSNQGAVRLLQCQCRLPCRGYDCYRPHFKDLPGKTLCQRSSQQLLRRCWQLTGICTQTAVHWLGMWSSTRIHGTLFHWGKKTKTLSFSASCVRHVNSLA